MNFKKIKYEKAVKITLDWLGDYNSENKGETR